MVGLRMWKERGKGRKRERERKGVWVSVGEGGTPFGYDDGYFSCASVLDQVPPPPQVQLMAQSSLYLKTQVLGLMLL